MCSSDLGADEAHLTGADALVVPVFGLLRRCYGCSLLCNGLPPPVVAMRSRRTQGAMPREQHGPCLHSTRTHPRVAGWGRVASDTPLRLSCQPDMVPDVTGDDTQHSLTHDQFEQAEAALADSRARLAEVPAEIVVVNHAMGFFELAAINL